MPSYQEKFLTYLHDKSLNVTRQRLQIADIFFAQEGHHTLDELYAQVKMHDPGIGQTTVYRTLKLLAEAALAHELQFGDGITRFEPVRNYNAHHDHIICQKCGATAEIKSNSLESIQKKLAAEAGYILLGHAHYMYGICPQCRGKISEKN